MRAYSVAFVLIASVLWADPAPADSPAGEWYGKSIGVAARTQGKDEEVIFHITAGGGTTDQFMVDADKIVDGRAIPMGRLVFLFDRRQSSLTGDTGHGSVWVLKVDGSAIEGTLTSSDGTLLRRLSLQKHPGITREKKNG